MAELTCPSCGRENPEGFGFCGFCGASLAGPAVGREERKVVTVLFCDLVGFTARSDRADPEDVKATLTPYHARLKREIEAFGGTLDKFIGDAALGVFGSPLAHEDDPERAIRAALAIRAAMAEMNEADPSLRLAVRQGINTGEAVVAYGAAGPQIGEAVTGDVVNTASRLQAVAPAGGIVVGEATHGATKDVFVFEPLDPVTVKGKGEPLEVWLAIRALGRSSGELARSHATPFVGRDLDLAQLEEAYLAAADGRSVQLVTITGEPGVGKSRLVAELSRRIEGRPGKITWRSGRCLPYGEGITFWALSEIVNAHAGILESDPPDEASAKLDAIIPTAEPDREWLRQRIGPLIGLEAASAAQRDEAFMAWRRFLESMALTGPAVLVFEDLHWADPALLEFIEHLLGSSRGAPLLLICTARPELRDRYPGWAEGARWVTLHPLSADETVGLISAMLDRASLPPQVLALLLDRAGGNPLYAQEFVRMLRDRGLLSRAGESWELVEGADIPYPDSIQSLIAARLDTLAPSAKAVLQDASIIGKVFWPGAVAAIGGSDGALVRTSLDEATSRDLVSVAPTSSIAGEAELVFSHALVRDVCYGQIPRAARATKHRAAAGWIEEAGSERVEELAELPQIDADAISDLVLHMRLTAHEGGSTFRSLVERSMVELSNEMLLSLGRTGWYAAVASAGGRPARFRNRRAISAWRTRWPAQILAWRTCSGVSAGGRPGRLGASAAGPSRKYSVRSRETCSGRSPNTVPASLTESTPDSVSATSAMLRIAMSSSANSNSMNGPCSTWVRPPARTIRGVHGVGMPPNSSCPPTSTTNRLANPHHRYTYFRGLYVRIRRSPDAASRRPPKGFGGIDKDRMSDRLRPDLLRHKTNRRQARSRLW